MFRRTYTKQNTIGPVVSSPFVSYNSFCKRRDSHTRVMAARAVARRRYSESTHSRPRSESVVEVNRCLQEPLEVPTPMFPACGQPSRPFWPVAVHQPRILNPHHRPCWRGAHRRRAYPSGGLINLVLPGIPLYESEE